MGETRRQGTILVPVDGSEAGEGALPIAGMLARVTGGPLRLLHVAEIPRAVVVEGEVVAYEDQEQQRIRGEAEDYLERLDARVAGLPVEHAVRFGDPTEEIVAEARSCGAALVTMSTRGRGAVGQLVMGSVAQAVARVAPCPVVMVAGPLPVAAEAPRPSTPARRCLACGGESPATFCPACEARIRGEALERKRGEERAGRPGQAA